MRAAHRLRQVANLVNLSTLLGLLVAVLGGARPARGPHGLLLAAGYRLPVPPAPAFTVGNVVVVRRDVDLADRPGLLAHEDRHATQYAWCVGPLMLPLYGLAAAWSWLRSRDAAAYNVFELLAGLEDGGYRAAVRIRAAAREDRGHG